MDEHSRRRGGAGGFALLEYLAGRAVGCRVVRAAGVESEMELVFAGLHQIGDRTSPIWRTPAGPG